MENRANNPLGVSIEGFLINTLIKAFGKSSEFIHFDEESKLVISKRKKMSPVVHYEFMVHRFFLNEKEPYASSIEYGSYCDSFDEVIKIYQERKK